MRRSGGSGPAVGGAHRRWRRGDLLRLAARQMGRAVADRPRNPAARTRRPRSGRGGARVRGDDEDGQARRRRAGARRRRLRRAEKTGGAAGSSVTTQVAAEWRKGRLRVAAILEMRGITKTFPGVKALSDVNLVVEEGEIHAICGENGAGKSALMKVLSGVHPYGSYDGDILYKGEVRKFASIRDSEHLGLLIIHQELALAPQLSIAENIFLGNETAAGGVIDWTQCFRRARDLMAKVGLRESPNTLITNIGVGKQQLVEICKALAKDVKLLILDEPTASLNEADSAALLNLMLGFKAQGMTSILISHKLNEIAKVADKITIIRDGSTVETLDCRK